MNTDKLLDMLLETIDYSFLQTDDSYCNSLTYPVIDKVKYIKRQLNNNKVKEVDLENELSYEDYKNFFKKHPDMSNDWGFEEAWTFAEYFYKLGLKAQKKE